MRRNESYRIPVGDARYPARLLRRLSTAAPMQLSALGNSDLLVLPSTGLFCSARCPGHAILATYDQAARWRDTGHCVISGFHSPVEKECLRILLRGTSPVIMCPARGMLSRIPTVPVDCRAAFDEGRLLLVSPFPDNVRRVTTETATIRNRFVASMAAATVVAHAAPGSKMQSFCTDLLATGKPLYTFDHPSNTALIQAGACPINPTIDWARIHTRTTPASQPTSDISKLTQEIPSDEHPNLCLS